MKPLLPVFFALASVLALPGEARSDTRFPRDPLPPLERGFRFFQRGTYYVDSELNLPSGETWQLYPDVVFLFKPNQPSVQDATRLVVHGTLNATGAKFTSARATPTSGDWNALIFQGSSTGQLTDCTVEYGGHPSFPAWLKPAMVVVMSGATLTMQSCTLRFSYGSAVDVRSWYESAAHLTMIGCNLEKNQWRVAVGADDDPMPDEASIWVEGHDAYPPYVTVQGCTISDAGHAAIRPDSTTAVKLHADGSEDFGPTRVFISGNTFQDGYAGVMGDMRSLARVTLGMTAKGEVSPNTYADPAFGGIVVAAFQKDSVHGLVLGREGRLRNDGGEPYVVRTCVGDGWAGWPKVGSGGVLTIDPGVTLQFDRDLDPVRGGMGIELFNGGQLVAAGTPDRRITFTSKEKGPTTAKYWSGLHFKSGSTGLLEYCTLEEGGGGDWGWPEMIYAGPGTTVTVRNSVIRRVGWIGVCAETDSSPTHLTLDRCSVTQTMLNKNLSPLPYDGAAIFLGGFMPLVAQVTNCSVSETGPDGDRLPGIALAKSCSSASVLVAGNSFSNNREGLCFSEFRVRRPCRFVRRELGRRIFSFGHP